MQQFAIAAVTPRSIAWLVRPDDWDHMETLVIRNTALLGGYYNAIVPMTAEGTISDEYVRFLLAYDADLVALPPGMPVDAMASFLRDNPSLNPFGIIPWDGIDLIASRDPRVSQPHLNVPLPGDTFAISPLSYVASTMDPQLPSDATVAVAEEAHPDTSRLALVACGDLDPARTPSGVDLSGLRERFLDDLIGLDRLHQKLGVSATADPRVDEPYIDPQLQRLHPSPPREHLVNLVWPHQQFPLTHACDVLKTCFRLQLPSERHRILLGRSALYDRNDRVDETRTYDFAARKMPCPPGVVILLSETFGVEDAALFWNLRACKTTVAWLPATLALREATGIADWLAADDGGVLTLRLQRSDGVIVAAPTGASEHIQPIYESIAAALHGRIASGFAAYSDVVAHYGISSRPTISREQMIVMTHDETCSFLPQLPAGQQGTYTVILRWNELMLPRCASLIQPLISPESIVNKSLIDGKETMVTMTRFRTSGSRYLKAQLSTGEPGPLTCYRPTAAQIVNVVFTTNTPYTRVATSSVANYHRHFIDRAGDLDEAVYYLTIFPYKDLLFSLADPNMSNQQRRPGWILKHPQKRWALHHYDLCQIMGEPVPVTTEEYYRTFAGILPSAEVELLQKRLIERGFVIKCPSCQHTSWYPAEQVGQSFRCASCYETTIYPENPPWVFKMPEVLWLGFEQHMRVPLLALNYMKQQSRMQFAYVLDSNIYWQEDNEDKSGNLDIICLCDGHLYVGEAKSNDKIGKDQTAFYHDVLQRLPIDGLIFATSEPAWRPNTAVQIAELEQRWHDRIIALTGPQLEASALQMAMHMASRLRV